MPQFIPLQNLESHLGQNNTGGDLESDRIQTLATIGLTIGMQEVAEALPTEPTTKDEVEGLKDHRRSVERWRSETFFPEPWKYPDLSLEEIYSLPEVRLITAYLAKVNSVRNGLRLSNSRRMGLAITDGKPLNFK